MKPWVRCDDLALLVVPMLRFVVQPRPEREDSSHLIEMKPDMDLVYLPDLLQRCFHVLAMVFL